MAAADRIEAIHAARQELETERAALRKQLRDVERQQKEAAMQLARAKRDLGELLAIRSNLRNGAQVVALSEYQKVVKLMGDNRAFLATKRLEFAGMTRGLRAGRARADIIETQLRQLGAELATFGRVIHFRGQPRSQEAGPERPEIREPEAVRIPD